VTIHLPEDLQRFVQAQVQSGRFTSEEEAVAAGLRLLRQREEAD
jgi:putative addiction module CopG family antidote